MERFGCGLPNCSGRAASAGQNYASGLRCSLPSSTNITTTPSHAWIQMSWHGSAPFWTAKSGTCWNLFPRRTPIPNNHTLSHPRHTVTGGLFLCLFIRESSVVSVTACPVNTLCPNRPYCSDKHNSFIKFQFSPGFYTELDKQFLSRNCFPFQRRYLHDSGRTSDQILWGFFGSG